MNPPNTSAIEAYAVWLKERNPNMTEVRAEAAKAYDCAPEAVTDEQLGFVLKRKFWNDRDFWRSE